jgi:DNA polymerase (family 10)
VTGALLAAPLRQLADCADVRGAAPDAMAWRRLAADLEQAGDDEIDRLATLARRNRLGDVPSIQAPLHPELRLLLVDGPAAAVRAAQARLPWLLRRLLDFSTVDLPAAAALARQGIVTPADLEAALADGRIATHFAPLQDRLRSAAAALAIERLAMPLGRAVDLTDALIQLLEARCPAVGQVTAAGGVRRFEPLVGSLAIAASAPDPAAALEVLGALPQLQPVLHRTARRALVTWENAEFDLRIAAPDEFGTALYLATGSRTHLAAMRGRGGGARLCPREADVYAQAGLAWIPPELRHGTGEIEAAASRALPDLVAREDIRGDLHMHSTYSDGRDSLPLMVQTCAGLGYEYIAITDHSERAGASRTVSLKMLARQRDEIARLREQFPAMAILHGIEVDIMPDGRLDFPDHVLEPLDIVLASLHDRAGQDAARLTRRCLAAIAHPLVTVITHPANRLVGRDPGYDLSFPAVYAAAAETGTALEIDGAPSHLDLDGEHAREAVAAGATVTIDSDCHRARLLDKQMRLGLGTARRGWVEPRHVLNTRPLADVRAFIAAKRSRR